ncbi:MAG: phosphotransferase [Nocardioidaceae bacterium]
MIPSPTPHGRTARRLDWAHLPPHVRAVIEAECGAPVTSAVSQTSGFTPGFASVLACADGTRHFVKAASTKAQRMFAEAYREEARKLANLPAAVPAPKLLWTHDADDWMVLGLEYVEARAPRRPWELPDLAASLDMLESVAEVLTPPPAGLVMDDFATDFEEFPDYWDHLRATRPSLTHLEDAAALARRFADVCAGRTVVHTDVRDDNILIRTDGTAMMCDWNFPCVGASWLDSVFLMIGPRGDGIDVEAVLAARPLTRDVPVEDLDTVLALLVGYFYRQCDEPVPPTSPHIRDHQRWQGDVVWAWLCERREWV